MRALHHHAIYERFHALIALSFLFGIVYGVFSLSLPILAESIFSNVAVIGFVFALPALLGIALDIPLGAFANRFGRHRTIFYSGFLLCLSAFFFLQFHHPLIFLLTLLFYEVAGQACIIPADAEVMALSPARKSGKFNGLYEAFHNFGYTIGPLIAGILIATKSPSALWIAFVGAAGMMLISVLLLPKEQKGKPFLVSVTTVWRRDKLFLSGFREFATLGLLGSFLAFLFFISALHWGFNSVLEPLYAMELGLDGATLGLIFAGFTLPFVVVSIVAGKYIDQGKTKAVTLAGLFFMAIATFGFGLTEGPMKLFVLSFLHGIGQALLMTALMSMFDTLSAYHTKERISSVKVFAESAGYFTGPLIAGLSVGWIGFSNSFINLGVITAVIACATLFIRFEPTKK